MCVLTELNFQTASNSDEILDLKELLQSNVVFNTN